MVRVLLASFAVTAACFVAAADDRPKGADADPIAVELSKAKEEYQSAIEAASGKLLGAFADRRKQLEGNRGLKLDQQVKLLGQLDDEKKAFAEMAKLPKTQSMQAAASDYRTKAAAARKKCEEAFGRAAERYRAKKDLAVAKEVLAEKLEFIAEVEGKLIPGKYDVVSDPRTEKCVVEFLPNGGFVATSSAVLKGTWTQNGREVEVKYDNRVFGVAVVKVMPGGKVSGVNTHANGNMWQWSMTRLK